MSTPTHTLAQLKCDRLNGIHVKLHSLTSDKSARVDFALTRFVCGSWKFGKRLNKHSDIWVFECVCLCVFNRALVSGVG